MRFLFVDRITHMEPRVSIRGLKQVTADDFYLIKDSMLGKVHFPSALIGETIGQLAAWNVMFASDFKFRPVAGIAQQAIMHRLAEPGETLVLHANIESLDEKAVQYNGHALVNDTVIFELSGCIGPMLTMGDFAEPSLVQKQFEEIYHPNEPFYHVNSSQEASSCAADVANHYFTWDAITKHTKREEMLAIMKITPSAPYFPDHFPKKPVLPLTVLLETIAHLATEFSNDFPSSDGWRVDSLSRVKMVEFVKPGDSLRIQLLTKQMNSDNLSLKVLITSSERRICHLECRLSPWEIQI